MHTHTRTLILAVGVIDFKHITPAGIPPKTQICPLDLSPPVLFCSPSAKEAHTPSSSPNINSPHTEAEDRRVMSRESHSVKSNQAISKRLMRMVTPLLTILFFKIEEVSLCRCLLQTAQFEKQSLFTKDSKNTDGVISIYTLPL